MIRQIRVKNFVHFHKEQKLSFEKGPYFFIGENESGKSCMFEAIRRCMSTSKNPGISSSHDSHDDTFVICTFDLSDESLMITSGIARIYTGNSIVKFVCSKKPGDIQTLYVDLVKKESGSWEVNEELDLRELPDECKRSFINHCFAENFVSDDFFESLKCIVSEEKLKMFTRTEHKYKNNTKCEEYLLRHVDSKVVITYPVRSIATVQWTESYKTHDNREGKRRKVKEDLRARTEIISWYYGPEGARRSKEENNTVEQYFRTITNNSNIVFEFLENEKKLVAYENKKRERPFSLEKVPEGYFEAMNCSILLAVDEFKTVCVEEVGRGMHPQMIERMRDLVLQTITNKIIISTTHIPTFFAEWNIPRVYFFRRKSENIQSESKPIFNVVCGNDIQNQKTQRMLSNQDYATLLFAARVFFVEGESDRLFLSAIKSILQTEESFTKELINHFLPELDIQKFVEFLLSLHIISLEGHMNKGKFQDVCKILDLEHYFLFDHDVFKNIGKELHFWKSVDPDIDETKIEQDVTLLEKSDTHVFVWRKTKKCKVISDGKIEGALVSLVDEMEDKADVIKFFKENHCELDWICSEESAKAENTEKQEKTKKKLFRDGNLTDENMKNVAKKVLKCCRKSEGADMSRLLRFLFKASLE